MTLYLHPNKNEPKRWKVQDKVLGVQKYFSFSEFGSQQAALVEAHKFIDNVRERRKARSLRMSLGLNQLFHENGMVRGLVVVEREGQLIVKLQFTKDGKQISNSRSLNNRTLRDAFDELCDWFIESKGICRTREIQLELRKSFTLFERVYKDKEKTKAAATNLRLGH